MRVFTQQEANETLAVLRPLVERLVEGRRSVAGLRAQLESVRSTVAGNGGRLDPAAVNVVRVAAAAAAADLAAIVEEIHGLGVQVKDLDSGLVDFPAEHPESGETVLLCWRLGEESVAFWHGVDEGFAGRKPLPF